MSTDLTFEEFREASKQYIRTIKDELTSKQLKKLCKLYIIAYKAFKTCGDMPNYIFIDFEQWKSLFWEDDGIIRFSEEQSGNDIDFSDIIAKQKIEAFVTVFLCGEKSYDSKVIYANSFHFSNLFGSYSVRDLFDLKTARESESTTGMF